MQEYAPSMPWDAPDTFGKRRAAPPQNVQWPLKLMRVSPVSPFFHRAHLLLAADCSAFSCNRFGSSFGAGKTLVIGCPDAYGESFYDKLADIIRLNDILSVTLVRMDSPCCRRMTDAVMTAIRCSRKDIPLRMTTLFAEGEVVD